MPSKIQTEKPFEKILSNSPVLTALLLALAGQHHLWINGPPGSGKTLLSSWAATLVSPLNGKAYHDLAHSRALAHQTDWTNPKPQVSLVSPRIPFAQLLGRSEPCLPSVAALAHEGVLLFEEFHTFSTNRVDAIKNLLEVPTWTTTTKQGNCLLPARHTSIFTTNPCFCGYFESKTQACHCTPRQKTTQKLDAAFRDRIHLYYYLESEASEFSQKPLTISEQEQLKKILLETRNRQQTRAGCTNGWCPAATFWQTWNPNLETDTGLQKLQIKLQCSHRSLTLLARVARTFADLYQEEQVQPKHLRLALQYRHRTV